MAPASIGAVPAGIQPGASFTRGSPPPKAMREYGCEIFTNPPAHALCAGRPYPRLAVYHHLLSASCETPIGGHMLSHPQKYTPHRGGVKEFLGRECALWAFLMAAISSPKVLCRNALRTNPGSRWPTESQKYRTSARFLPLSVARTRASARERRSGAPDLGRAARERPLQNPTTSRPARRRRAVHTPIPTTSLPSQ